MEKLHIILTIVAIGLEARNIAMTRHLRHVERKVGVGHRKGRHRA